jgi:hypothetical protein
MSCDVAETLSPKISVTVRYANHLLPKQAIDQMFTPYAQVPDVKDLSYGYGWFMGKDCTLHMSSIREERQVIQQL